MMKDPPADSEGEPEPDDDGVGTCVYCGRTPAAGMASTWTHAEGVRWFCHGDGPGPTWIGTSLRSMTVFQRDPDDIESDAVIEERRQWSVFNTGTMSDRLRRVADHLDAHPSQRLTEIRVTAPSWDDDGDPELHVGIEG